MACSTPLTGAEKSITWAIDRIQGKRKRAAAAYQCDAYATCRRRPDHASSPETAMAEYERKRISWT